MQDNTASTGGFIMSYGDMNIKINKCNFINNKASYGGAFIISGTKLTIIGSNNTNDGLSNEIVNNVASVVGGFIQASVNSIIEIQKYNFNNNRANSDGGAFWIQDSTLSLIGSVNNNASVSIVKNNTATENGGFIYLNGNSILTIRHYKSINSNQATYGGAFSIKKSILTIIGYDNNNTTIVTNKNEIYHNIATINGGFICAYDMSMIKINKYHFFNNTVATINSGSGDFLIQDSTLMLEGRDNPTTFEIEKNNINLL